jgi:DNA end-binding protein Ku
MPALEVKPTAAPSNVVNLMDALRRSVAAETKAARKAAPKAAPAKKGKKRVEGQREMLLPITGKGPSKEAAEKKPGRSSIRQRKAG